MARWWAVLLMSVLAWVGAGAQGPVDGVVRGRVVTADGGPVPVVAVKVRGEEGGEWAGVMGDAGRFVVAGLLPGEYAVEADGVGGVVVARARVVVGLAELVDVTLVVGKVSAPAEETNPAFEELPLRDRQWEGLSELEAGASDPGGVLRTEAEADDARSSREGSGEAPAAEGAAFAGQSPGQNEQVVDGLTTRQSFRGGSRGGATGGARTGASFGEGAIRSFRILPRTFSAQFGGTGGVIAVVTQAGAARVHGSGFLLERWSALAAANPFSVVTHYSAGAVTSGVVKPRLGETQLGGAVGFAVLPMRWKERVKAFASVEEQVRSDAIVSTPATANFYALSAGQVALLGNRGVSLAAQGAALTYLDGLTGEVSRLATRTLGFSRVDVAASKRDSVTVAEILQRFNAPAGMTSGAASEAVVARGLESVGDSLVAIDAVTGRWVHGFSARRSNEMRAQVARDLEYETPRAPLPQEPAIAPGGLAPEVRISPEGFAYGTPASLGRVAYPDERRVQVAEALQMLAGRNLLTVGGDWSRVHDRVASLDNAEGTFDYDSGSTNGHAGGLVDWITDFTFNVNAYPNGGCPSINAAVHDFCFRSFTQSFAATQTTFVTHEFAGFAEDAFRLRSDLAVTLGVRYDYTLLPFPQTPNRTLDGLGFGGLTSSFPEDRNNVGPRVAVAWSPVFGVRRVGWFTARAGYGTFYGRVPGATVLAGITDTAMASATTRILIRQTTETVCPQAAGRAPAQGFGFPCVYTSAPPAVVAQTTSATVFAGGFRLPAVQRVTFELEHEMGVRRAKVQVKAAYVAALSRQLPESVDRNIAAAAAAKTFVVQGGPMAGEMFSVPLYTARVATQFGPVTAVVSSANATYHAGTLEARVRTGKLEARGSFTFSRAIDYAPQLGAVPRVNGQFDPFSNGYDKGLSSLHFPVRFAGDLIYVTALRRGPVALQRGLGGWRFAAIATAGSGSPYSYEIFGGTELAGGRESINGAGGAAYLPTVGRNTLRMPVRGDVDLRVGRDFRAGARMRLQAFAEAFNLSNTKNVSRVETRAFLPGTAAAGVTPLVFQDAAQAAAAGTAAFGTALSSTTGLSRERQVEVGLRLNF